MPGESSATVLGSPRHLAVLPSCPKAREASLVEGPAFGGGQWEGQLCSQSGRREVLLCFAGQGGGRQCPWKSGKHSQHLSKSCHCSRTLSIRQREKDSSCPFYHTLIILPLIFSLNLILVSSKSPTNFQREVPDMPSKDAQEKLHFWCGACKNIPTPKAAPCCESQKVQKAPFFYWISSGFLSWTSSPAKGCS